MGDAIATALTAEGARRAFAVFHAVADEDRGGPAFISHTLDRLAELVGSDLTTLSLCDLERQRRATLP